MLEYVILDDYFIPVTLSDEWATEPLKRTLLSNNYPRLP